MPINTTEPIKQYKEKTEYQQQIAYNFCVLVEMKKGKREMDINYFVFLYTHFISIFIVNGGKKKQGNRFASIAIYF